MVFFRKNKRRFGIRSHRRVFVALFLFGMFCLSGAISLILNTNAQLAPIREVEIFSQHASFTNNEPGAWKVAKTAEWIGAGKARVTFEAKSIMKRSTNDNMDVVLVIDNSGSMAGEKIAQVRTDAVNLIENLLAIPDNKIALVTFNSVAAVESPLTNNKDYLLQKIEDITTIGTTNYYQGLLMAMAALSNYEIQDGRDLVILFLTDGSPNEDTSNEITQYRILKAKYPTSIVSGIQYETDASEVWSSVVNISDYQYLANRSTLGNILLEAIISPYTYSSFVIEDFIDDTYWNINDIDVDKGSVSVDSSNSPSRIEWNISGVYRSGQKATMTIDLDLKNEYSAILQDSVLIPTNNHEVISSALEGEDDEEVNSSLTPVLKSAYSVSYEASAPTGCELEGVIPNQENHIVYTSVEISDNLLMCEGYSFNGWVIDADDIRILNDDHFRMPEKDIVIRATWGKVDIAKTMDGTVHERAYAVFDTGPIVNAKMKVLSEHPGATTITEDRDIINFVRSNVLLSGININNTNHVLSSSDSDVPIYAWYDSGTLYYYTEADEIYLNANSARFFCNMYALANIEGTAQFNTSRVTDMALFFNNTVNLSDLEPIRNWDISNVRRTTQMFYTMTSLVSIEPLSNWDTSSVANMSYMFRSDASLSDLSGLRNWDVSNVTDFAYMFAGCSSIPSLNDFDKWRPANANSFASMFSGLSILTSLNGLSDWGANRVTGIEGMFSGDKMLSDISAIGRWNVTTISNMGSLFNGDTSLVDISPLSQWTTSSLTKLSYTFNETGITDLTPISGWDVSKVTTMVMIFRDTFITTTAPLVGWNTEKLEDISYMFNRVGTLRDISGLDGWETNSLKKMEGTFYGTNVADFTPIGGWDTSNVTNIKYLFASSAISNAASLSGWNTINVTDMSYVFMSSSISNIDGLSGWETDNVKDMSGMFTGSSHVTSIAGLSGWNTDNVQSMTRMFTGVSMTDLTPLIGWNTANVKKMDYMFSDTDIQNLDALINWDTSNVTTMAGMFNMCEYLSNIDGASGLDTNLVVDVSNMFYNDTLITNLSPIENWNTTSLVNTSNMFEGIPSTVARPTWYH